MTNLRNCSIKYLNQFVCSRLVSCSQFGSKTSVRSFSQTNYLSKSRSFYDDLGIPRTATQSEIKSAYYTQSMTYHPDKNKSEEAKQKFRRITEAYEVLGNFRTRRMYDKGIGTYGKSQTTQSPGAETEIIHEEVEDDAQTKFYKQHMIKSQPPEMADRMTARDIDQFSLNRRTACFHQAQKVKQILQDRKEDREDASNKSTSIYTTVWLILVITFGGYFYQTYHNKLHDNELKRRSTKKS